MFITVGDAQIFSVAFGSPSAPAILGIGGWIGNWELWALPFARLSADWYTVAYDHRGSGATVAPVDSITVEQMTSDLFAVMDAYGLTRCYLAAESAGAVTALSAALERPDRIAGLILVDGHCGGGVRGDVDPFLVGLTSNYAATLDAFVEACVPEPDCDPIKRWGRQILGRAERDAAIALYREASAADFGDRLLGLAQPALILHGERDSIAPLDSARRLSATLPHAQLVILPGAGHVPTMTRPDEVAREIDRFLRATFAQG